MADVAIRHDAWPRRAIVRLRVPMSASGRVAGALRLPDALQSDVKDHVARLWLGPEQWLLVSDRHDAAALESQCAAALGSELYLAVDNSAALHCLEMEGPRVRELLAMGSGLDWSPASMPAGRCTRARFASIAVIAHVTGEQRFDVYIDRSHRRYLDRWLVHAIEDPLLRERRCPSSY